MKILVCFEGRVRPDSTGMYLLWALQKMGHEVTHMTPEKIMDVKPGSHDFYLRCDDGLKMYGWNPELHPSHYYAIDTHIESDWRLQLAKDGKFDSVSVVHSEGMKLPWIIEPFFLPVGCDPEKHDVGYRDKKYDGCAIMNFHSSLCGPRVEMLDVFFKACGPNFFFGNRTFREMAEKYTESKLVFQRSINGDISMRCFEAMCSGSCLVTDRVPDLAKLGFVDGVHYAGYSSGEELEQVVKELLKNDEKRERIAAEGRREVLAAHTYENRMKTLLELTKGEKLCLSY